ncbi:MAG: 6-bladed beta-propeller [Longimicrobiales bacterium]
MASTLNTSGVLALFLVALVACGEGQVSVAASAAIEQPDSAVWTAQTAWRLSQDPIVQIQGSDANVEEAPLDPVSVFRLGDGRYVVADGYMTGWDALLVYDERGQFLDKVGGEGAGPGEFGQLLSWSGVYRGDSIAAYDFVDRALEIFTSDGKFARALILPRNILVSLPAGTSGASDFFIGAFADGQVLRFERTALKVPEQPGVAYYEPDLQIYDQNGGNPRRLSTLRTSGHWWDGKQQIPYFLHSTPITLAGRQFWYHATGEDFTIRVFDQDGRPVRILRRPFTRERVTPEDRENMIRQLVAMARSNPVEGGPAVAERIEARLRTLARFADVRPLYSKMVEDADQNLWIEHYRLIVPDSSGRNNQPGRWSVFARTGAFLGELEVPPSFTVSSITNDQVLGFLKDELDVEHVRMYGLIKPGR